jgi:hypothetical protein
MISPRDIATQVTLAPNGPLRRKVVEELLEP